jgi:hypothetical protein
VVLTAAGVSFAAPAAPPGLHIYLVRQQEGNRFWRGAAPTSATLEALAAAAAERGVEVTLVDLRVPPTADDQSGKDGRLSPAGEAAMSKRLGLRYVAISALDRRLVGTLRDALSAGDVYLHCMYGVNRTGFAAARYARATRTAISRAGLGSRDWQQGDAFQARLERARPTAPGQHP